MTDPTGRGRAGDGPGPDRPGVDHGALYARLRDELLSLVASRPRADLDIAVPATPDWTVHDVIAHLVGITADLNAGRFPSGGEGDWTDAQVRARSGATSDELAAEWEDEAPTFEDGLRLLGEELGNHFVADLVVHATDVRSALGVPSPRDVEALDVALAHYLGAAHERLEADGVGTLVIVVDGARGTLGRGPETAWLTASRFEVLRATAGRRSADQVRALSWRGDVEAVLPLLSAYPLPASDLVDPAPAGPPD